MKKSIHWAVVAAALVVAACAGPSQDISAELKSRAPTAPPSKTLGAAALAPAAVKPTKPRNQPNPKAAAAASAPPPAPRIKSAALMGLAENALGRFMGVPAFTRIDDPAALWQYRGISCILDVFLYADGPVYRVTHLEFRPAGGGNGPMEEKAAENCFSGLLPAAKRRG